MKMLSEKLIESQKSKRDRICEYQQNEDVCVGISIYGTMKI